MSPGFDIMAARNARISADWVRDFAARNSETVRPWWNTVHAGHSADKRQAKPSATPQRPGLPVQVQTLQASFSSATSLPRMVPKFSSTCEASPVLVPAAAGSNTLLFDVPAEPIMTPDAGSSARPPSIRQLTAIPQRSSPNARPIARIIGIGRVQDTRTPGVDDATSSSTATTADFPARQR